ncbi:chemotaxis protein CheB [Caballeronia sp. LZ001]|uniref:chemotaxis protein CheB n=1 Tax=Caballeronia sp. LZ001 TaxID=3038553 RepID=UPI00285F3662|nr:chemotaxis protein CheB [Caballeronia sp. LZ001]MDR5806667.1 chemotaxis protein CheB [Caballeronia sp. LZ001]
MDPARSAVPDCELDDGTAGLKEIAACGGFSIVQTPTDYAAPDRPTPAHEAVSVDVVAPVNTFPPRSSTHYQCTCRKGLDSFDQSRNGYLERQFRSCKRH